MPKKRRFGFFSKTGEEEKTTRLLLILFSFFSFAGVRAESTPDSNTSAMEGGNNNNDDDEGDTGLSWYKMYIKNARQLDACIATFPPEQARVLTGMRERLRTIIESPDMDLITLAYGPSPWHQLTPVPYLRAMTRSDVATSRRVDIYWAAPRILTYKHPRAMHEQLGGGPCSQQQQQTAERTAGSAN